MNGNGWALFGIIAAVAIVVIGLLMAIAAVRARRNGNQRQTQRQVTNGRGKGNGRGKRREGGKNRGPNRPDGPLSLLDRNRQRSAAFDSEKEQKAVFRETTTGDEHTLSVTPNAVAIAEIQGNTLVGIANAKAFGGGLALLCDWQDLLGGDVVCGVLPGTGASARESVSRPTPTGDGTPAPAPKPGPSGPSAEELEAARKEANEAKARAEKAEKAHKAAADEVAQLQEKLKNAPKGADPKELERLQRDLTAAQKAATEAKNRAENAEKAKRTAEAEVKRLKAELAKKGETPPADDEAPEPPAD